ncbi:carboxypeptidase-like regulatory domain-containing protein [Sphingobacterium wenxiniae]|uniref:CarboxypepD_reg-like domain-containing protein n=1 Tax=Sphingobacterium wenxiniae TaxID=683125 RepID=A0A1I6VG43_9SPHI|nr:carboxypeptidase-like regulatory domain-containing protein [Sphingobacterium wenxiniae]SFT12716.1 CarboxypepD_reg-like domain-containing protein [Sphingobacterium wenxiniae]
MKPKQSKDSAIPKLLTKNYFKSRQLIVLALGSSIFLSYAQAESANLSYSPSSSSNFATTNTSLTFSSQQLSVRGVVVNADGQPIENATVKVRGSSEGTQTGTDGTFNLEVQGSRPVLVITHVSYSPKEITVAGNQPLRIVMDEGAENI